MDKKRITPMTKEIFEWIKILLIALILTLIIRTFFVAPFLVDGESMMPTLLNEERVIVNKLVYMYSSPQYGDIIVFHYDENKDYIKRIIGLPGDIVQMQGDQLLINGKPVQEPYLNETREYWHEQGLRLTEDFGPVKVDSGQYFVLGDNRRNSKDSRMIGTISKDQIVGRTEFVFWPINDWVWLHTE